MAGHEDGLRSHRVGVGNQQLVIITQLLQMSVSMQHIDEMFLWLSHMIAQRLGVEIIQFWAAQSHITGQQSTELRAMACQNLLFPLQAVNNARVSTLITDVLTTQSVVSPQPIASAFSAYQAELLGRYHLFYWACFSLSSNILLPPMMNDDVSQGAVPTPLNMAVSLFTQHAPHPQLLPSIKRILEQALSIARNRGLLSNGVQRIQAHSQDANLTSNGHLTSDRSLAKNFTVKELIPRWVKDLDALQAENPFSSSIVINDKQARRLYFAIDGKKSLGELMALVRFDLQDFKSALDYLLWQKLIRLHAPDGTVVDSALFLKELS
jgi:hypothetical protein